MLSTDFLHLSFTIIIYESDFFQIIGHKPDNLENDGCEVICTLNISPQFLIITFECPTMLLLKF